MKIFLVATLILSGCSTALTDQSTEFFPKEETAQQRSLLLGKWVGERESNGDAITWSVTRFADGTYTNEFRIVEANGARDSWTEVGIWGVRKPVYFTAVRGFMVDGQLEPADVAQASLYDAYKIVSLKPDEFTYISHTSGTTFTMVRAQ